MARAARGPRSFVDPLEVAFGAAQQAYKGGLLAFVNARRRARELEPVGWPAVGSSARDEVWRDGGAQLVRYRNDSAAVKSRPAVLLVASLINRPYVLDLLPGRSVVERLLASGLDVYLLDWGTPREEDASRGLGGYALELLPRAFAAVEKRAGAAPFILGYCMGGTLALMAAGAGAISPAGVIALATPVALHDEGLLSRWCRVPELDPAAMHQLYGNIPPHLLQPAFKLLDPVGLMSKWLHLDDKIEDDDFLRFFLAMETWLEDSVSFPGAAFVEWVGLYRSDALARGRLTLDGRRVDLGRVRCPVYNVMAEKDYITPPGSSLPLEKLVGGDYSAERIKGGHIGLSTGGEAHRRVWPLLAAWMRERSASPARKAPARKAPARKAAARKAPVRKATRPRR
jgi:polyhydroxyalkanoate synthase